MASIPLIPASQIHQGEGQLSLMNPKFTLSPVLWLEQPEHLLIWASWERKGKGGIRLCAFLCSQWDS